ncbi:MAG: nitrate ABC transporter, partial [Phormidesmis sp. CAN_BIN36]|nr:nitrate ABC transporter [Phormidesmis sp. CAN_BIN36]
TLHLLTLSASEHEQAYKQNLVDAVITFDPVRSNLLKAGAKILFDSSQIPGEIVDVLVTRRDLLKNRKADLESLVHNWFRALDYHQQNPQDAARRMALRGQVTPEKFIESLKLIRIPDRPTNLKLLSRTDPSFSESAKRLGQIMIKNKLLKQTPPIDQLMTDQLIKVTQ